MGKNTIRQSGCTHTLYELLRNSSLMPCIKINLISVQKSYKGTEIKIIISFEQNLLF